MRVSVIIPVYRDWARLRKCLSALAAQSMPRASFEIIVVDNDETPLRESERPPGVRYVHEPAGYSYAARNAGVRAATSERLAFTDADCLPEPSWLATGVEALNDFELAGGAVEIFSERDTIAARYDRAYGLRQAEYFERWQTFATANLFLRRGTFDRVGAFNAGLESGGDFEFCWRAKEIGLRAGYAAFARVRHPARDELGELIKQTRRIARGMVEFKFRRSFPRRRQAWREALQMLVPDPRDWYAALAGGRGTEILPPRQRPAVLGVRIFLHYVYGFSVLHALQRSILERGWP